jgi:hypothetical protein
MAYRLAQFSQSVSKMSLGFVVESSGQDFQDGRNNLRAVMLGGWLGADILTDSIEVNSSH